LTVESINVQELVQLVVVIGSTWKLMIAPVLVRVDRAFDLWERAHVRLTLTSRHPVPVEDADVAHTSD
jgi:hypothetical protein